jgi:DNA-binding transcriptional LysR family regulator
MEFHQLRYFLEVCETLSFTRAAERCGISQPALTNAIKKLEADLGGPLFYREGRRVLLSELGELMRPQVQMLLAQTEKARLVAKSFRLLNQAPLRVGTMSTIGPLRLAEFLSRFQAEHPGVELALEEGITEKLRSLLDKGELDLAIMSTPGGFGETVRTVPIYEERYVVIFAPGHRFERLNAVRLQDVSGEPYVDRLACELREMVMGVCQERDVELYAKFRSEREDWVQAMVSARIGFAFMPECSVTHIGVLGRPLVEPEVRRTVEIVRMPGRPLTPAASAFLHAAQRYHWSGDAKDTA